MATTNNGYLVIGDVTGFTAYFAQTELEHSQEVLAELLELILDHFQPVLRLAKLEGDAVFAHAPAERVTRGELLIEILESTYVAFRDKVNQIVYRTTCECNACRAIPMLDLKFMLHYGSYVQQDVMGSHELVGSDVNLLHRLTKNHVAEETGWKAYALFTMAALNQMQIEPEDMHTQSEEYEHLGQVQVCVLNLRERYQELTQDRRVFISPDEADIMLTFHFSQPPPIVWDWLTDPHKKSLYGQGAIWTTVSKAQGRTGTGARNHCAHGKDEVSVETILDWHPFDYYSFENLTHAGRKHWMDFLGTSMLEALPEGQGTRLHDTVKFKEKTLIVRIALGTGLFKVIMSKIMQQAMDQMEVLMKEAVDQQSMGMESSLVATIPAEAS